MNKRRRIKISHASRFLVEGLLPPKQLLRAIVALLLIASLSLSPSYSQITIKMPVPPHRQVSRLPERTRANRPPRVQINVVPRVPARPTPKPFGDNPQPASAPQTSPYIADLERRANSGEVHAAFLLGQAYYSGQEFPSQKPNLTLAVSWLNRAADQGDLEALYTLGTMIKSGQVLVKDSSGALRPDPRVGEAMMNHAMNRGYDPPTHAVTPPKALPQDNSADGLLILGALVGGALLLAAAFSSGSSSQQGASPSGDSDSQNEPVKFCMLYKDVEVPNAEGYGTHTESVFDREGIGYECH